MKQAREAGPSGAAEAGSAGGGIGTLAALVVALVLGSGVFGEGGRHADSLLVHQSLLLATLGILCVARPRSLHEFRVPALCVGGFCAYAAAVTRAPYSTLLVLTDVGAAATLYVLGALAARCGRWWGIGLGSLCGAGVSLLVGLWEWARGRPVHGLYTNPHHGAGLVAAVGVSLLAVALARGGGAARHTRLLAAAGAVVAAAYAALVASRGALLAFGAGTLVVALLARRRAFLGVLGLLLVAALVLPTPLGKKLRTGVHADRYAYERVRIWRASARMARDHLLAGGVGLGSFEAAARRYNFPVEGAIARYGKRINHAHSEYLQALAEASVPGLVLLLVPLWLGGLGGLRSCRAEGSPGAPRAVAGTGALAALAAHALVDVNLHSPENLYLYACLGGTLWGAHRACRQAERPPSRMARAMVLLLLASLWLRAVWVPWAGDRAAGRFEAGRRPEDLARAARLVPSHAGYQALLGGGAARRYLGTGDLAEFDEACRRLREAHRLNRLEFSHLADLAGFEHRAFLERLPLLELAQRSLSHYREASELSPFDAALWVSRAALLGSLGRLPEATAAVERAVELEPNFRHAWLVLASVHEERGEGEGVARARREIERIDELRRSYRGRSRHERRLLDLPELEVAAGERPPQEE